MEITPNTCNCCNDKALSECNFEKLAIRLYDTEELKFNYVGWDKEPQEYKWKYRNKARDLLEFLGIESDTF